MLHPIKLGLFCSFNLIYDNRGILGDEENSLFADVGSYEDPYKDEYET